MIAFVREAKKLNRAFVAVEFSPKQKQVLQCYAASNQKPPQEVVDFVNRLFVKQLPTSRRVA